MKPIPSREDIHRLFREHAGMMSVRELAQFEKVAQRIESLSREINARRSIAKSTNIHTSGNALLGTLWARFRRRLNWIEFMHFIKKSRRRTAEQLVQGNQFQRGKSRLPKKRKRNK